MYDVHYDRGKERKYGAHCDRSIYQCYSILVIVGCPMCGLPCINQQSSVLWS